MKKQTNKIIPVGCRISGYFFIVFVICQIYSEAFIWFSSFSNFVDNISIGVIFMLPISLYMITTYYSFDADNLILHLFSYNKGIPICTIIEIRYFMFGTFILTVYRGMLNQKYYIPIMLLCSKKGGIKRMERFIELVLNKNCNCILDI